MALFGSKTLDYRFGDGTLPKMKSTKYFPHHLPGQPTLTQMNFELLSEEAKNGKHQNLLDKAVSFALSLDYSNGDYNYANLKAPELISDPGVNNPGDSTDEAMAFLANRVKQHIDNGTKIYFELLPYLEKFELNMERKFTLEQRKLFMCIFRVGMGLSLIENLSSLNVQGYCHPSISNVLHGPRQVLEELSRHGVTWNLDFVGDNSAQMALVKVALYVGYFQSKYTAESPASVMEFVVPITK
jgi:hypothetical protein